ncbi:restriction endonuclease subunit S [Clostridium septicum]|uniref:Restriction endonuclease subunit S n=1 Tax=Clostridium septicum TaxID=1504 RepID=A0A9N7JJS0_CLOSE|nr:restriction endonuclease subunit S [Clostridium septicum]AYE33798.1 restriction endonuclease subunit S [Clostridium septicum]QAS61956.1 restriction endonuclease subunit S [Clostridium septicum]UEC21588.1 restriction endonuclease subunit S [Clostridium septicum]USS00364.1 restriction endonuclease subunit S [Clostridium septicum]
MKYKLSDIFQKPISGEWGSELEEGKKGVKVLRTTNFTNLGRLNLNDVVEREIDINKHRSKILKQGDIIIEKSGGSPTQPVGRVVIFEEGGNEIYFCNNFTSILRPQKLINSKYSLYLMKDLYNKRKVLKYQNKTTGIINLKLADYIANTEIILPTINVQIKIAKVLDKAQELIDKRKEQIQALDELTKSQFIEMFGTLKNEHKLPLEKCTTFIDYRGKTPTLSESGIRIINAKSVGNGFFKYIDEYISEETYDSWMKRGFPVAGDVLFVTEGHTFGNVCRIPNDLNKFAMGQRVITMQGKEKLLNNVFLAQYMQSMPFKIDIDKYKTGSSAQGIRSKELQKILIPIPNIELQNQFADFVKQTDRLKLKMEKSLKELEDNFNSLMQRAFNGELFSE